MRISLREEIRQIPGTSQVLRQPIREWICPECDYFEEADQEIDEELTARRARGEAGRRASARRW